MPGAPNQVVALLAVGHQVMAEGKVAQPQQLGDRNRIRAWQAGLALAAEVRTKALGTEAVQPLQAFTLLVGEGAMLCCNVAPAADPRPGLLRR